MFLGRFLLWMFGCLCPDVQNVLQVAVAVAANGQVTISLSIYSSTVVYSALRWGLKRILQLGLTGRAHFSSVRVPSIDLGCPETRRCVLVKSLCVTNSLSVHPFSVRPFTQRKGARPHTLLLFLKSVNGQQLTI